MLFVAALLAAGGQCLPAEVAGAASVSQPAEQDFVAADLIRVDGGLEQPVTQIVRWQGPCTPEIVRLFGGRTLVTASGLALWPIESRLAVRDDKIWPADPEPPHPAWEGRHFTGSASLAAGTWRVGAWVRKNGVTDLARYRPEIETAPIPMLTSTHSLVGVFYLGAPDAFGGTLSFAQRLGPARFRMVSVGWSEGGLRAPTR